MSHRTSLKRILILFLILAALFATMPVMAQEEDQDPGIIKETPSAPTAAPLTVQEVEPTEMSTARSGTLSLYGSGFTAGCVVRMVGYGLLTTSLVNETALTAQVPAGVPAGTYDLEVSDGAQSATLEDAVRFVAPKPTPKPDVPSTPPPGRPILTVRNTSVEPAQVRPGQEFVVTIEIYNNGSRAGENTLVIFPGGTFLPVGESGHHLWQLPINHTAVVSQRMRAPDSLSAGVHQLKVDLSANDWAGDHFNYPTTVPVEVVGGQATFTGSPKIVVEEATTAPNPLVPGEPFSLTLVLANRGRRTAIDLFAQIASTDWVVPLEGGDLRALPALGLDEVMTTTIPLELRAVDEGGKRTLTLALEYGDYGGGTYSDQRTFAVEIDAGLDQRPQLVVSRSTTEPQVLNPGDPFTLTVSVDNVGGGIARRLVLALGGEGGAALAPFIPVNAGNVAYEVELKAGETWEVSRTLMVGGDAEPQAYNLPVALTYDDDHGRSMKDTQRLSLIVYQRPEIKADFYRQPETMHVDQLSLVSLEVVNVGRGAIDVLSLEGEGAGLEVTKEGVPFVGPLDPGGSAPLDLNVRPLESGSKDLVILLNYRDAFNQRRAISDTLSLDVEASMVPPGGQGDGDPSQAPTNGAETPARSFWNRLMMGLLGLGS